MAFSLRSPMKQRRRRLSPRLWPLLQAPS